MDLTRATKRARDRDTVKIRRGSERKGGSMERVLKLAFIGASIKRGVERLYIALYPYRVYAFGIAELSLFKELVTPLPWG